MTDLAVLGMRFETVGAEAANRQLVGVANNSGRAERASDALAGSMRRTQTVMAGMGRALGLLGVATGVSAAFLALRSATLEYASSLRELSTLVDTTVVSMDELSAAATRQAGQFNSSTLTQTQALYQIISAGASTAAQATETLTAANMLAVGGVTTVTIAADGLTSVLNAYGDKVEGATAVSDAMFVAMRAGKTTIAELSASLGTVAPLAAQTGVSFDELTAATAALTKGGISTNVAVTGLRAILAAVAKPSSEAEKLAKALGLEFNSTALASKGLAGFMEELSAKTGGNTDALALLFGGVEALVPVMALSGQAGKDFADILEQMGGKAGATGEAFDKIASGPTFQLGVIFSTLAANAIAVGNAFLNTLAPALTTVAGLLTGAEQPSLALDFALKALAVTAGVTATVALYRLVSAMVASGVSAITSTAAFRAYVLSIALVGPVSATATAATTALGVAIRFALGPIGLAITAIGLLTAAWTFLVPSVESADAAMERAAAQAGEGGARYLQLRDAARAAAEGNDNVGSSAAGSVNGMSAALGIASSLTRQMTALGIQTEYAANAFARLQLRKAMGAQAEARATYASFPTNSQSPGTALARGEAERQLRARTAELTEATALTRATTADLNRALARPAGGGSNPINDAAAARAGAAARALSDAGGAAGAGRGATARPRREVMDPTENFSLKPLTAIVHMQEPLRVIANELRLIDGLAQDAARGMADAFGEAGRAMGDLLTTMTGYQSRLAEINLAQKEGQISAMQADRERASAQIQSYGDMAGAAKGFFKEGSDGYKAMQAAEQAFRIYQFAMAVQAMVMDTTETGVSVGNSLARGAASAAAGAAKMFEMLGPFAFPVVAGMLALLVGLGLRGGSGGGGSSAKPGEAREQSVETARSQVTTARAGGNAFVQSLAQTIKVEVGVNDDRFNAYVDGRAAPMAMQAAATAVGVNRADAASASRRSRQRFV